MARQITERGRTFAQEHEESRRFREAAAFYGKIATTWQQVAVRQTGDWQRYCQSFADYWAERADATQRRADEEAEALAPARLLVAGQTLPATRATSQKPITRPLGPTEIHPNDDARMPKGVTSPRGASQSKDKKPLFRR
jgi:hypothetical protein